MALVGVVMCGFFTSCSSDDDEEGGNGSGGRKKLIEIKEAGEYGIYTYTFAYNGENKLVSINEENHTATFSWGNNAIIGTDEDGKTATLTLANGLVKTSRNTKDNESGTYTYNSSNQLISLLSTIGSSNYTAIYTWENGKITKREYDGTLREYTYDGKTCKGWCPIDYPNEFGETLELLFFCAHPELCGKQNSQLPSRIRCKDIDYNGEYYNSSEETYTYVLNKDGYVESCTVVETYNGNTNSDTTIYTFKWE